MNIDSWVQSTFIFYIGLICACFILSIVFVPVKLKFNTRRYENAGAFVPLFILICVKGFALCGTDLISGYKMNFETALSMKTFRDQSTEIGYRLLNVIIRNFTTEYSIFLFAVSLITIVPVFCVIKKYSKSINIPSAIIMYAAIFFLPSISLIRIYIASSICILSFDALFEKKYLKAIIIVIIASTVHITAIVMIVPCLYFVCKVNRKLFVAALCGAIAVLFMGRGAMNALLSGRYAVYSISAQVSLGTEWLWYYVPLIIFYFYILKLVRKRSIEQEESIRLFKFSSIWILIGTFFSLAQYAVSIFGRMAAYTLPLILFVSSGLNILKKVDKKKYRWASVGLIVYCILRFIIYITGYYMADGIMPYINCFGWKI